ncbi:trigger factor [Myxococcota bacterium]|nr:trigger factor [Myxococcota bacterium]
MTHPENVMQYDLTIEDVSPIRRRLRFTVGAEQVKAELDSAYNSLKGRARLPGFRPGKAPRNVLEARFGKQVSSDVGARLMEQAFRQAAGALELAGQPAVEEQGEVRSGNVLTFVIGVDVKPAVSLDGYSGLRVEYPAAQVREADVDASVRRVLQGQARIAEVTEDRPVQAGDRVLAALKLTEGETVLADEAGTMVLTQGERFYPGLESLLIGLSKGGTASGQVSIGAASQFEHLKGKQVQAEVTVLGMQAVAVPELSDELAAELGYEGGAEGMRAALRMRLQEQVDEAARNQARVALLQQLVERNPFDVPGGMIDEQFQALVEELRVRRAYSGQDPRSVRFSDAEVADLRSRALFAARASVILAQVAKNEKIEVADGEVDARVAEIAKSRGQQVEAIRAYLQREQAFGVLRTRILEEKTLEWLLEASELVPTTPTEGGPTEAPAAAEPAPKAAKASKKAAKAEPAAAEPAAAEPAAEPAAAPSWNKGMKKEELLAVAQQLGLDVNAKSTKAQILEALDQA